MYMVRLSQPGYSQWSELALRVSVESSKVIGVVSKAGTVVQLLPELPLAVCHPADSTPAFPTMKHLEMNKRSAALVRSTCIVA